MGDPGAAAAPGLEQEFFDAADGFAKWCNGNGGINGYQLVIDKLDAKLFNGGAEVTQACQRDFMLVGGGNALDANDVKPRLGCKLGQVPAYTVSPQATNAGLQVSPAASVATNYPVGVLRLLGMLSRTRSRRWASPAATSPRWRRRDCAPRRRGRRSAAG